MKKLILSILLGAAVLSSAVAGRNETQSGNTVFTDGTVTATPTVTVDFSAAANAVTPFSVTQALVATNAATPVTLVADSAVPAGKKVYVDGFKINVSGTNGWAAGTVTIRDSSTNAFAAVANTALTNAAYVTPVTAAGVTLSAPFKANTGSATAKGLQVIGSTNTTGSDLNVTVHGVIK